jgi:hypothetical protein
LKQHLRAMIVNQVEFAKPHALPERQEDTPLRGPASQLTHQNGLHPLTLASSGDHNEHSSPGEKCFWMKLYRPSAAARALKCRRSSGLA